MAAGIVVTEASIRSSLLLNDADGTACLTNKDIFQNLNKLTFQKAFFSPQWKYLIHTILHCLSSKSTSWNEFSTNIASAVICLATNQKFNFSKLIFDGMLRNLDNPKKKFLMYPRFLMVFLNNQIELGEPFNDVYITPAHTLKVFSNMSRKGLKFLGRITPLFSNMLASTEVEEGEGSEQPTEPQPTPSPTQPSVGDQPHVTESSSGPDNTHSPSMNLEGTGGNKGDQVQLSNDSPHSGGNTSERAEGGLNLEELLSLCTNLSNRVLALETAKDAQAAKILKLKTRIKKLEKKCKPSISHHRAWLKSVKRLSMKNRLGKKEPVSKQGRKSTKPGPTLDAFDDLDADLAHGMDYMDTEEAVTEGRQSKETEELNVTHDTEVLEKGGSNEEPVNAAGNIGVSTAFNISTASRPEVSTATPMTPPTTSSVFEDEDIFLVDALVMLSDKAKLKGVEIKEKKDAERPAISVLTLKPLPIIDPKDKGKGVLEEEPEPVKVKSKDQGEAQIERDAEIALKVQAELDEEARLERQRQEQASLNYIANLYDEVQAKNLMLIIEFASDGTQENMESILCDRKSQDSCRNRTVGLVLEEPDSAKVKVKQEGNKESARKIPGRRLKMKVTKKSRMQKTDSDLEKEEHLKTFLKLVPDEEGIIDYEVLEKRFPIINWESKFYHLDRHGAECIYYRIFRSDESSRWIKTFSEMVTMFDRLDLEELYNLVMQRFESSTPEEDDIWKNQEEWILRSWNFYENCGVHTLILEDGTEIHMLAERKYPLTKETLERMMSLKLIAESASESAYNLLSKELASPKQTALALAIPEQTATGKEISNPFMAGSLPKTTWPT
ncbi:hypothetical protein Tco_0394791 [Tanacetum coccineum]